MWQSFIEPTETRVTAFRISRELSRYEIGTDDLWLETSRNFSGQSVAQQGVLSLPDSSTTYQHTDSYRPDPVCLVL